LRVVLPQLNLEPALRVALGEALGVAERAETTAAAETAYQSGEAVTCPGDECVSTAFQFSRDWDALGDALTKWDPYL